MYVEELPSFLADAAAPRLHLYAGLNTDSGAEGARPSKRVAALWDEDSWSHCSVGGRLLEPLLCEMTLALDMAPHRSAPHARTRPRPAPPGRG